MEEKIKVLAEFLGIKESEILKGYRDNMFETSDGEEYLVVTDEEADDEFYNYEAELIDELGLDAFTDWAKDYIIENCVDTEWFENFYYEDYESYANDIETESSSSDEYENRLEEEMTVAEVDTKEDFVEYMVDRIRNDLVEEFEFNFGKDMLRDVVSRYDLLDVDAVIDYIKEQDGRGILASYDGKENEEGEYFIYRIN